MSIPSAIEIRRSARLVSARLAVLSIGLGLLAGAERLTAATNASVSYRRDWQTEVPWSVQIARLDLSDHGYEIIAPLSRGTINGLGTLSDLVQEVPATIGSPVAAVNGDFYQREGSPYTGDPRGIQIVQGEVVSAPGHAGSWWLDKDGRPHLEVVTSRFEVTWPDGTKTPFGLNEQRRSGTAVLYTPTLGRSTFARGGRELVLERDGQQPWLPLAIAETYRARVREVREQGNTRLSKGIMVLSLAPGVTAEVKSGDVITLSTATTPDLRGARAAIGGGAPMIQQGRIVEIPKAAGSGGYEVASQFQRHPRTAAGWNDKDFFLIQVDGRQPGLSVGMTLSELAEYMRTKLNCTDAISLDGGGSSTFWYNGRVRNSPCDGQERFIANGLIIVRKPKS